MGNFQSVTAMLDIKVRMQYSILGFWRKGMADPWPGPTVMEKSGPPSGGDWAERVMRLVLNWVST